MEEKPLVVSGYDEVLLAEAEDCAERSRYGSEVRVSALRVGAALSAVWAACAAVEAFVSERGAYYRQAGSDGQKRISKKELAGIRNEPRTSRKLNRLVKCFFAEGLKEHPRYPDLQALLALRDATVRGNAEHLAFDDWPEEMKPKYRERIPVRAGSGLDWTSRVFNEDTAAWAAGTCRAILSEAGKHVPKPPKALVRKVHVGSTEVVHPERESENLPFQYPH